MLHYATYININLKTVIKAKQKNPKKMAQNTIIS